MNEEIKQIIKRHIDFEEKILDSEGIIKELKESGLTKSNLLSENIPELKEIKTSEEEKKKEELCKGCKWYLNCYECKLKEKIKVLEEELKKKTLDLAIDVVEIHIREDEKVIWVNAPNCVLRICQIKKLIVKDERKKQNNQKIITSNFQSRY